MIQFGIINIFLLHGTDKFDIFYRICNFKVGLGGELVEHGRFLCVRKTLLYKLGKLGVKWLKK